MRCDTARDYLDALHDGELGGWQAWRVRRHVEGCSTCAAELASLDKLDKILLKADIAAHGAPTLQRSPSADAAEPIRLFSVPETSALAETRSLRIRRALAPLAAGAALLVLLALARGHRGPGAGPIVPGILRDSAGGARKTVATTGPRRPAPTDAIHRRAIDPTEVRVRNLAWEPLTPTWPKTPVRHHAPESARVEDDLVFANAGADRVPGAWARLQPAENLRLQQRWDHTLQTGDDFVSVPFPRIAGLDPRALTAAKHEYQQQKALVDPRLQHKLTLAQKAASFADLCKLLSQQSGIDFSANRSVADDKITLFCTERPLREILRQITQVFGFLWRRSGEAGEYKYELYQDLRSQLMEEELRNRDRNEALIALDGQMEGYRKYLNLTPEQARAAAQTASGEEKSMLEALGGTGWAPAHLYFGLSPEQMGALQAGQEVGFASSPEGNQQPFPTDMSAGILKGLDAKAKLFTTPNGHYGLTFGPDVPAGTTAQLPSSLTNAKTSASLKLNFNDLGQVTLEGISGFGISGKDPNHGMAFFGASGDDMAVGISPSVRSPQNAKANADLSGDPALGRPCSLDPQPAYRLDSDSPQQPSGPRVTTADVLEQLHKQTGMDVVADYFTRLYDPGVAKLKGATLFDLLNRVCDAMRLRWTKADGWLRVRSTSFFNDRLKEVPNRLLGRWAASRKAHGALTIDDLMEIAQLTDNQLNSPAIGQGARAIYGLAEWELGASDAVRPHWRFLAALSANLRQAAFGERGLSFAQLPVPQQQRFIALVLGDGQERMKAQLDDLAGATLRAEYTAPDTTNTAAAEGAGPERKKPDVKFTYRYGGPNLGRMKREIGPKGIMSGSDNDRGEHVPSAVGSRPR